MAFKKQVVAGQVDQQVEQVAEHSHEDLEKKVADLEKEVDALKKELAKAKGGADPRVDAIINVIKNTVNKALLKENNLL